jgi:hypothetical protein
MIRNIREHGKKGKKSREYNADSPTLTAALKSEDTERWQAAIEDS